MCHHTREPTVLSMVSSRPSHLTIDRFHQPCLFTWAHFQGQVKTVIPAPRGDHLPLRAARLFPPCVSLEVLTTPTRRYHGTTDKTLIRPSSLACATPTGKGCLHKFGTLASPPPPVERMPWGPHPPGHVHPRRAGKTLVSSRTLSFCFPLTTNSLFSFNST